MNFRKGDGGTERCGVGNADLVGDFGVESGDNRMAEDTGDNGNVF